jgi:capsular polysaccharide biosynthesis protein
MLLSMHKHEQAPELGMVRASDSSPNEGPTGGWTGSVSLLASLQRHPFIAILAFAVVAGSGWSLVTRKSAPQYYANSLVYVSPTSSGTLRDDRTLRPQYDIQQKMLIITRYAVVNQALQKLLAQGIDLRRSGESDRRATERLVKAIEVLHLPDTYEISIGLHRESPVNLAEIVNTLTETFIDVSKSEEFYGADRRVDTLNAERARLDAELTSDQQESSNLALELGVVTFDELPADRLVEASRNAVDRARRERMEAEAEVALFERDASVSVAPTNTSPPIQDTAVTGRRERLMDRKAEIEATLETIKPGYPDYGPLSRELARITRELADQPVSVKPAEVHQQAPSLSSQLLAKARIDLERARKAEAAFTQELDQNTALVEKTIGKLQRGRDLGTRMVQLRTQINAIDDRLSYLRMESDAPGLIRVSSPARTPLVPEKSKAAKYYAALFLGALFSSIGTVLLIDAARPNIRTVVDVERILGFPPIGALISSDMTTRHFAKEQFLRMVNNVERAFRRSGVRVFVFTPVGPQASSSRLVNKIAAELRMRDIRAHVVDANTDQELIAPPARMQNQRDDAEGTVVLRHSGANIVGAIFARSERTDEKYASSYKRGFFNSIEERKMDHDLILVDAAPLLLSAETEHLVTLDAITFLTVEAGQVRRNDLKRAASLLEKLRASGVAAILYEISIRSADPYLKRSFAEHETRRRGRTDA